MRNLTTQGGEMIDKIVFAEYGDLSQLEEVIRSNPHINFLDFILPGGLVINLPPKKNIEKKAITLW